MWQPSSYLVCRSKNPLLAAHRASQLHIQLHLNPKCPGTWDLPSAEPLCCLKISQNLHSPNARNQTQRKINTKNWNLWDRQRFPMFADPLLTNKKPLDPKAKASIPSTVGTTHLFQLFLGIWHSCQQGRPHSQEGQCHPGALQELLRLR